MISTSFLMAALMQLRLRALVLMGLLLGAFGLAHAGPTTTALSVSPNPAYVNQDVILTATVSGTQLNGTVTFKQDGTAIGTVAVSASGQAQLTRRYSSSGTVSLTATYNQDPNGNTTSTSTAASLSVIPKVSTRTTLSLSANPVTTGQSVTLSATVVNTTSGPAPAGSVAFKDGTTVLQTVALSAAGTASLTTSFSTTGTHSLAASYVPDAAHASSNGYQSLTVNPGTKQPTTTTLSMTPNPVNVGRPVTLVVTITGTNLGGSVTVTSGATTLHQGPVAGNTVTISNVTLGTAGSQVITASYAGDATHEASSGNLTADVVPYPTLDYEYDAQGNLTKVVEAKGIKDFTTQHHYDTLDRRKDTVDARNKTAYFGYNGQDWLTGVTDPKGLPTTYDVDGLGNLLKVTSRDAGATNQTFDAMGRLKTRADARGVKAIYAHDALGRLKSIDYVNAAVTQTASFTWTYDQVGTAYGFSAGRLTSTAHPTGSTQFKYDELGRVMSAIQRVKAVSGGNSVQINTTTQWHYDGSGHVTRIYYPSGARVDFNRSQGLLTSIAVSKSGSTPVTLLSGFRYEPFGPVKSWNWHMNSGTQAHVRSFDLAGRMAGYPLGNVMRDVGYDAAGRISGYRHTDASGNAQPTYDQSFDYDELGRLKGFVINQTAATIGYDDNGNRTSMGQNGTGRGYTVDANSNRLTGLTNPNRTIGYAGPEGSAGYTTSDGAATMTYTLAGQMEKFIAGGVTTTYSYDNDGRRVRKVSSTGAASAMIFVYGQDGELLSELDSTGKAIREYVWIDSTPVAVLVPDQTNTANPPVAFFIHADHIDTPRVVVDRAGKQRWNWMNTDPWGVIQPDPNPSGLGAFTFNLRFPGQYYDQESGLFYNHHRYYDPSRGAFPSADPIGLAGTSLGNFSLYPYANNAPTKFIDPTGLYGLPWEMPPGMVPVPPPVPPQSSTTCTCEEWQYSIGISGSAGGSPVGFGPFGGGGMAIGLTSNGNAFIQFQGTASVGLGLYGGVGVQAGVSRSPTATQTGMTVSNMAQADFNVGTGPSIGASIQGNASDNTIGAGLPAPGFGRFGVGVGLQASAGVTRSVTIAGPPMWPQAKCR